MSKFSFDTVSDFDNHISSSICGYEVLHTLILNVSSFFIKKETVPIDLGCTSGKLLKAISEKYQCKIIGYDITDKQFIDGLDLRIQDLTEENFCIPQTNLIFSVFTLQFIEFNKRLRILKKVYSSLNKNGCFVFCEKEICSNGVLQEVFTFSNYQYKQQHFTPDEILKKEYDLRNIMNIAESKTNLELLRNAGFKTVEPFFQSLNFKGYLCIK
jgi:tRNA (cmo5U34)-methyltransferase